MAVLTREQLLAASDLQEKMISLPSLGPDAQVRIRSLPAEYSNAAVSKAIRVTQGSNGEAVTSVDNGMLELLQVQHGLVEPNLESLAAVQTFAKNCGPAFKTVVKEIVKISGLDDEAVQTTAATFPGGGGREAGTPEARVANGNGEPAVHA